MYIECITDFYIAVTKIPGRHLKGGRSSLPMAAEHSVHGCLALVLRQNTMEGQQVEEAAL